MDYADKLFQYRVTHGLTQARMANKLHCSRYTINSVERRRVPVSHAMQVKIDLLGYEPHGKDEEK